jgi:DNA-binding NarL/FixJ family response regulator
VPLARRWFSRQSIGKPRPDRQQEVPTIELTNRERRIIELLTAGASEEDAAAELGLSRRTVVYTLRTLMDRIGVENRFQLALVLGASHTIPLPPAAPGGSAGPAQSRET